MTLGRLFHRLWMASGIAGVIAVTGAEAQAQQHSATVTIRWAGSKPDAIYFDTPSGQHSLVQSAASFSGRTPPSSKPLAEWPLIARYGEQEVTLILTVRHGLPSLSFELPKPAPEFCHVNHVESAEKKAFTVPAALRMMLSADHLLKTKSPNSCSPGDRNRLIRARLSRNYDAVRLSGYLGVVPEFRAEYAAIAGGSAAMLATLEQIDREALGVEAREIYAAQKAAQAEGEWARALEINQELERLGKASPAWREALATQQLDAARLKSDEQFLGTQASAAAAEASPPD